LPGNRASIDVLLDGAPCVPRWVVPIDKLKVRGAGTDLHLALIPGQDATKFHAARMRAVKFEPIERASPLANAAGAGRPVSEQAPLPPGDWTDLLKLIDIDKNVVAGKWQRSGTELTVAASQTPRIAIPISIDGGYDLVVDFTRTSGDQDVAVMLSVAGRPCMVNLSAAGGAMSGLQNIDSHQIFADNPIVVKPGYLENDRYYRLSINVRILSTERASIDVVLDGKPYLPHWEGSPASLSASNFWPTPNPKGFGLGAQESDVTFHAVRLRMVSGDASADLAVQQQGADGAISFPARDAIRHGEQMRLENVEQGGNIGVWIDPAETVEWKFIASKPGIYTVIGEIAVPSGGKFTVAIGNQSLEASAPSTGSYHDYQRATLGQITISSTGKTSLTITPIKEGWRPVNLKSIALKLLK
jgi:hypothetical protein